MNRILPVLLASMTALRAMPTPAGLPVDASLGWMSGQWCSHAGDETVEEYWMPAGGDMGLGLSRTVKAGKTTSFEFLRIRRDGNHLYYVAQPQGDPPTDFLLTASGASWARFENPAHDFPVRIEYRRTATGLSAEVSGPDRKGGQQIISFDYRLCAD